MEEHNLAGKLSDFCSLPVKPVTILSNYLKTQGIEKSYAELVEELNEDYAVARDNNAVAISMTRVSFPIRYTRSDDMPISIFLKPNDFNATPWFLYFVDYAVHKEDSSYSVPGKQLENFAFLGSWMSFLTELAERAIPEEWDFESGIEPQYKILRQYIKYTFSRLLAEKKICITKDEQFAAFNTGLVDNRYDDIFACFTPNPIDNSTKWRFAGFCTAASGSLGKLLVRSFTQLPEPPAYFQKKMDLLYNHLKPLYLDYDHIIVDNINRLPIQFIYNQAYDNEAVREILTRIRENFNDSDLKYDLYNQLRKMIKEDNQLFKRISNRLDDAASLAKKKARWNYRTAIPLYYPKNNSMSLMLPLALVDDMKPDVALVVELMPSGSYQGQTVLTLSQAYIDARLVCRLTGDWLELSKIPSYYSEVEDI